MTDKRRQLPYATCGTSMRSIKVFHVGTAFLFVKQTRGLRESDVHQRSVGIIMYVEASFAYKRRE